MRLDVLGSSGSHTGPGSVCSGYLLRTASTTLLLDAGNGSTARLHALVDLDEVDAILVSHRHVDHCVDLLGLHYARRSTGGDPIPVYAPAGTLDALAAVAGHEAAPWRFRDSFDLHDVAPGDRLRLGDVDVELHHAVHTVPAVSMRCSDGTSTLTYSGDTAGGDELLAAALGADAFLCEATWQGDADAYPSGIHLTARDAGSHAAAAGVGRLLLTHIRGGLDRERSVSEARETFGGDVTAVQDGDVVPVEVVP